MTQMFSFLITIKTKTKSHTKRKKPLPEKPKLSPQALL